MELDCRKIIKLEDGCSCVRIKGMFSTCLHRMAHCWCIARMMPRFFVAPFSLIPEDGNWQEYALSGPPRYLFYLIT